MTLINTFQGGWFLSLYTCCPVRYWWLKLLHLLFCPMYKFNRWFLQEWGIPYRKCLCISFWCSIHTWRLAPLMWNVGMNVVNYIHVFLGSSCPWCNSLVALLINLAGLPAFCCLLPLIGPFTVSLLWLVSTIYSVLCRQMVQQPQRKAPLLHPRWPLPLPLLLLSRLVGLIIRLQVDTLTTTTVLQASHHGCAHNLYLSQTVKEKRTYLM